MAHPDIPQTQRAFVVVEPKPGSELLLKSDHPVAKPDALLPGQCLVKIEYSGVCHSDLTIRKGLFPNGQKTNLVGGHEGVGVVVAIGQGTTANHLKLGDRVGVKFMVDACANCEQCLKGAESFCPFMKKGGHNTDGTFCEYVLSYVNHVTLIPDGLSSEAASAIMCAGITVYSALKHCGARIGDWVVLPGSGGGLGHLAVQYAVAMGIRVLAIDTGEEKKKLTLSLGAEKWIDFKEAGENLIQQVVAATDGGPHAAIVTASNGTAYNQAVMYLRTLGTLMCVGLPLANLNVPIPIIAVKGLTIRGCFVANRQDSNEAVRIAASGKVKCNYSVRGFSELPAIFDEMDKGQIVGRVVLDINK
ncbi:GroES-like protein [Schizopora paradoxa]|uniref:alcohol dehydrogenase n=1 Tax=Schizopora paradoxa TaxID=27342 RepID=A0A0H2RMF7_9AGAM|nr:GroES-like protein [Schizopora paradoxa]